MKRQFLSALVALSLVGGTAASAIAGTITVGKGDIQSIQDAVEEASDGDTIVIPKGTYNEFVSIEGFEDLTIKGSGNPTISGTDSGGVFYLFECSGISISGLTLTADQTAIDVESCMDVEFSKLNIMNTGSYGIYSCFNVGLVVTKCKFMMTGQDAIRDDGSTGVEVTKSQFDDIQGNGIYRSGSTEGVGTVLVEKSKFNDCSSSAVYIYNAVATVLKNTMGGEQAFGIYVDGSENAEGSLIEKNKITSGGSAAIYTNGTSIRIRSNKLTVGNEVCQAMYVGGDMCLIEKNKINGGGCQSLYVNGTDHMIFKNSISNAGSFGMYVAGEGFEIDGNKISKCQGGGMYFDGDGGHTVTKNKVTANAGTGILVFSGENMFTSNKVLKNLWDGFYLGSGTSQNVLSKNTAKKNNTGKEQDTFDIKDDALQGENTINDDNKYGTMSPPVLEP